ncbi:MAG: leucine--tRNA ligase, partial [Defluviitaleaceae bacterium]|nr:leucine--tRNA ligase [Defluviitaleaceae bacterium]
KRNLRQWMLRITDYAERLLADLADLDWPEKVKKMQAEWIGKSYGAHIDFAIDGHAEKMTVFTTRPDTLFGATFMVLAPEHPLVAKLTTPENRAAVDEYVYEASMKSNVDRMAKKDKTGIFIGAHAINPGNGEKIQIWISDYVLADYGTGCIMCVPGHDERDHEFALKFGLPIVQVVDDNGVMINSPGFDGMDFEAGKTAITAMLAAKGLGEQTTNYKLRDWVFSRQRYWGEPIPLIHCEFCGTVPVPEADLPVILPHVASYQPTDTGESPLALISDWVNVPCPACGTDAKRETNTMPQWAGSSWYFLRYADPKNNDALISEKAASTWLPVDYYVGGVEHAVLHLLYARFYTKFLYDIGVVKFEEPFKKLFNQGMICRHGVKMSKSKGNGVSPDELIESYGCDSLRLYLLFIGPPEQDADWDDRGIEGCYRFLSRVWRLVNEGKNAAETRELKQIRHKLIFDVSNRLGQLSLNTVISAFMEQTNKLADIARVGAGVDKATLETLVILLSPFAPHIAEELWEVLGHKDSVFAQSWPEYDPEMLKSDSMTIVVQINGKVRENIHLAADMQKEDVIAAAKESIAARLADSQLVKEIYVPGKLVNFVIKS